MHLPFYMPSPHSSRLVQYQLKRLITFSWIGVFVPSGLSKEHYFPRYTSSSWLLEHVNGIYQCNEVNWYTDFSPTEHCVKLNKNKMSCHCRRKRDVTLLNRSDSSTHFRRERTIPPSSPCPKLFTPSTIKTKSPPTCRFILYLALRTVSFASHSTWIANKKSELSTFLV